MLMIINIKISIAIATGTRQRVYSFSAFCKDFTLLDTIRIKYQAYQVLNTGQDIMEVRISLCSALCVCSQCLTFREYTISHQKQSSLWVAGTYTAWKPNYSRRDVLLILQWWNVAIYMKLDVVDLLERKYSSIHPPLLVNATNKKWAFITKSLTNEGFFF